VLNLIYLGVFSDKYNLSLLATIA